MDAKKLHILVVEDNILAATMTKHILESLECQVEFVDDGSKAVECTKKNHYDGIAMDIGLPTMTGIEACIAIRAYEAQNHLDPVPIVAITANNSAEEFQKYISAGMQHALEKPFTPEKAVLFLSFCKSSSHT